MPAGAGKKPVVDHAPKSDVDSTAEPRGGAHDGTGSSFVIQHHLASSDHYDLRLEADGVLKSWAVPKGPSTDPRDKRLAVPTGDHPLEYASFEGTIGRSRYGVGVVQVWDAGTYENTTEREGERISLGAGLDAGHVTFRLNGQKLTGGYSLTRFHTGDGEAWLLIKARDDDAHAQGDPVRTRWESVRTGRTMDEIAAGDE